MMANRATAAQTDFQRKAAPLASDLIEALEKEHIREVELLYRDQLQYREELKRVVSVMQQDMIPREKQLHDLLDKVNASYMAATKDLHGKMAGHVSEVQSKKAQGKQQLLDPLSDMETELRRMTQLLQKPIADQKDLTQEQKRQIEQQVAQQSHGTYNRKMASARIGSPASPGNTRMATPGRSPQYQQQIFLCEQEAASPSMPSQWLSSNPSPGSLAHGQRVAACTFPYHQHNDVASSHSPTPAPEQLHLFNFLDKNHDGMISKEEFKRGMQYIL